MLLSLLYILGFAFILFGLVASQHFGVAVLVLGLIALLWSVFINGRRATRESENFIQWLWENLEEVQTGGARYRGEIITRETELVSYSLCMSIVVLTTKESSGYLVAGSLAKRIQILFTAGSLIFGWWALPFGPILNSMAIGENSFGKKKKVSAMIKDLITAVQKEEKNGKSGRFQQRTRYAE